MPSEETRRALSDLIGPNGERLHTSVCALDREHWSAILEVAERHRVLPLMHWRLREAGVTPPEDIMDLLQREMLASTQRVLVALATARRVDEVLAEAGVPAMFLKGVHLAADVYPQAGLRPMRDVDVLVPERDAMAALAALERAGATRDPLVTGDRDAIQSSMHHLPPMVMPVHRVRVEVHTRLGPRTLAARSGAAEPPSWEALWGRSMSISCAGRPVHVLSPEHLLLHLVVHAVYQHELRNGPLVVTDIGLLLARYPMNWGEVWQLAQDQRAVRGVVLMLKLLEREWGPQPAGQKGFDAQPRVGTPDAVVLDAATALLLQESVHPGKIAFARAATSPAGGSATGVIGSHAARLGGAARVALQRIFVSRQRLALTYPVKADSLVAFTWYPRYWWWLVSERLPEYLRYRRKPGVDIDIKALGVVEAWLRRAD